MSAVVLWAGQTWGQLRRELFVQLVTEWPEPMVRLVIGWSPTDPYALTFDFDAGTKGTVRWLIGRYVLAEGLEVGRAGIGDVELYRLPHNPDELRLVLTSHEGAAVFGVDAPELEFFLQTTWSVVPAGQESRWLAVPDTPAGLAPGEGGSCDAVSL